MSSSTGTRFYFTNTTGTIWQASATLSGGNDTAIPSGGAAIQ